MTPIERKTAFLGYVHRLRAKGYTNAMLSTHIELTRKTIEHYCNLNDLKSCPSLARLERLAAFAAEH